MSPPPCVPLPAALPRIQGSSKAPRKVSVIKAGETVLECEATGMPPPTVTWVKDGQPVAGGDGIVLLEQGRRLCIPKADLAHTGRYTCLVANAVGQEQREFDVTVHGKGMGRGWWLLHAEGLGQKGCAPGVAVELAPSSRSFFPESSKQIASCFIKSFTSQRLGETSWVKVTST